MFLKTTTPITAVLQLMDKSLLIPQPTESYSSSGSQVPEITTMTTGPQNNSLVLAEPIVQTTPMTVIVSRPIIDLHKWEEPRYYGYVLIPVVLMFVLAAMSILAFFYLQQRKKLDSFRHRLIPVYSFSPLEEQEWDVLLEMETKDHPPQEN